MIFSLDDTQCIATPSKCGSTALEHALKDHYYISPRHRVDYWRIKERVLVIRHPLVRYYSAFWHLSQSKGAWGYMADGDDFFGMLHDAVGTYDGPWIGAHTDHRMWTMTFMQMVESFAPHRICRLEDGLEHVAGVPVKQRWPSGDPKRQRTARRPIELCRSAYDWLMEYTRKDRDMWYEREQVDVSSLFRIG